jgi:hypothetical protein
VGGWKKEIKNKESFMMQVFKRWKGINIFRVPDVS